MALSLGGWIETMRGYAAAGRELLERARRLSARDPHGWISARALAGAAVADGDFPQAIAWAEEALAQNRRHAVALRALAVAEVNELRLDRAWLAIAALLDVEPGLIDYSRRRRGNRTVGQRVAWIHGNEPRRCRSLRAAKVEWSLSFRSQ